MKKIVSIFILLSWMSFSCKKRSSTNQTPIPNVPVSLQVNLSLPGYFDLTIMGNWMYFPDGYHGLIVYHGYDDQYYAYDRACPYEPTKDCSVLWMDSTTHIYMFCGQYTNNEYVKCCDSRFQLPDGFPVQGPANTAMKSYNVARQGNVLYIGN
ncbi:MAG: hypothetical protein GC180_09450 [Bacteroidetes bacterium]|nr:hypothetical protein [Bacteroidota bacterium]